MIQDLQLQQQVQKPETGDVVAGHPASINSAHTSTSSRSSLTSLTPLIDSVRNNTDPGKASSSVDMAETATPLSVNRLDLTVHHHKGPVSANASASSSTTATATTTATTSSSFVVLRSSIRTPTVTMDADNALAVLGLLHFITGLAKRLAIGVAAAVSVVQLDSNSNSVDSPIDDRELDQDDSAAIASASADTTGTGRESSPNDDGNIAPKGFKAISPTGRVRTGREPESQTTTPSDSPQPNHPPPPSAPAGVAQSSVALVFEVAVDNAEISAHVGEKDILSIKVCLMHSKGYPKHQGVSHA